MHTDEVVGAVKTGLNSITVTVLQVFTNKLNTEEKNIELTHLYSCVKFCLTGYPKVMQEKMDSSANVKEQFKQEAQLLLR